MLDSLYYLSSMYLANHKIKYFLLLASFQAVLIPKISLAQILLSPTDNVLETETEELYRPLESGRLKLDLSNESFNSKYLRLSQLPENINVRQIKIIGNTVFSTEKLADLINLEQKTIISQDDLRLIIDRINGIYRDNGYITSGVFNEPKIKKNGLIFIPITEGRIEDVKISGLTRLRENYIRQRLFRDKKRIFNQGELKQALQLLQIDRLIDNISGTVVPGSTIGSNILEVEVKEDDQFYIELSVDNLGGLTSGSLRRQVKVNHDNLLGFGDRFFAAYTNTDGRNSLDNLGGIFTINSSNGTVGIDYGVGKLEAIQEPLDDLDLDLNFSTFQIFARQPIYRTPNQELALGIALNTVNTETTLFNEPFPINRSADQDGELNISSINFYQDYIRRGRSERFDLRSQLSLGVDLFDATQNDDAPDSNFFIWRGQTSYLRKITSDLELSWKSYWQLSDRALVYFEQNPRKLFTLGREEEAFILRGYARNSLAGDNGIFTSAELKATVLKIDSLNAKFQLIPFIDFGTAWNNDDLELDESTLIAAGLGIRLLIRDNFRARVDWGIPLIEKDLDRGSLQEDGVTFNIEYRPL